MSQSMYMKIVPHIITDDADSKQIAAKISGGLSEFIRRMYGDGGQNWRTFYCQTDEGFMENMRTLNIQLAEVNAANQRVAVCSLPDLLFLRRFQPIQHTKFHAKNTAAPKRCCRSFGQ